MDVRLARVALVLAVALAPAFAADDDFTDIPDLDPPTPPPSAAPPPRPGPAPAPVVAPPSSKLTLDAVQRYRQARQDAITDRVLALGVCGNADRIGGDARRTHAHVHDGDTWLARGDAIWWHAQRTGERRGLALAMRHLNAAHEAYRAARVPPPLKYSGQDSPRPKPFPSAYPSEPHGPGMGQPIEEPREQWRRHDEYPYEEPSKFDEDHHW